jgi:hypothetical protein
MIRRKDWVIIFTFSFLVMYFHAPFLPARNIHFRLGRGQNHGGKVHQHPRLHIGQQGKAVHTRHRQVNQREIGRELAPIDDFKASTPS